MTEGKSEVLDDHSGLRRFLERPDPEMPDSKALEMLLIHLADCHPCGQQLREKPRHFEVILAAMSPDEEPRGEAIRALEAARAELLSAAKAVLRELGDKHSAWLKARLPDGWEAQKWALPATEDVAILRASLAILESSQCLRGVMDAERTAHLGDGGLRVASGRMIPHDYMVGRIGTACGVNEEKARLLWSTIRTRLLQRNGPGLPGVAVGESDSEEVPLLAVDEPGGRR